MKFDASKVKKILVISLTNIGDCVLTFPVIDVLKENFPASELSIVVGPKAEGLLKGNPHFKKIYLFDKHQSPLRKLYWILNLAKGRFDLAVDLRHSAIPFLLGVKYRTALTKTKADQTHKRFHHLARLRSIVDFEQTATKRFCLWIDEFDKEYVSRVIKYRLGRWQRFVAISPGAAAEAKRWPEENFAVLGDRLIEIYQFSIIFVGDNADAALIRRITGKMNHPAIDLSGQITLTQLAQLLRHASFVVANDSAVMHMASYLDLPVVSLFGPTHPEHYGPWGRHSVVIHNNTSCPACQQPALAQRHNCLSQILPQEVLKKIQFMVQGIVPSPQ